MELNRKGTNRVKKVRNPEGAIVDGRLPEIQLYLEASNLKIKEDSFYQSANDKLKSAIELADSVDEEFVLGLSRFLTDGGLKLSPVVLLSTLSDKGVSFNELNFNKTFNTPQRIAEAIALENNGYLTLNNSFKKHILKAALENMSDYTIKKNQMGSRKIKTRDLIKLLRPKPKNDAWSNTYKAIIENKMASPETLVTVKSDKNKSDEQKVEYYIDNIDKIPVNMLIRNLKFIADNTDFRKNIKFQESIINRLNGINDMRFLNIFDIITAAVYVPRFELALHEVVKRFADKIREDYSFKQDATFLFDFSGSMEHEPFEAGFKYLVLLSLVFDNAELRTFESSLNRTPLNEVIKSIKQGKYQEARATLLKNFTGGGTALVESVNSLFTDHSEIKNLIVISDEVSWEEGDSMSWQMTEMQRNLAGRNLILINPKVYKGTVFKGNVLAIASLTSGIVYDIMLLANQQGFIKYIKEYKW